MVTKVTRNENDLSLDIQINQYIELTTLANSPEEADIIVNRIFQTGIFVTEILEIDPVIRGKCRVVIFGKQKEFPQA